MTPRLLAVTALLSLAIPSYLRAQEKDSAASLERRLATLEQRITALEQRADKLAAANAATTNTTQPSADADRLDELDQKLRIMERKKELDDEQAVTSRESASIAGAGKDGFFVRSADNSFQIKLSGYLQADGRTFHEDTAHAATNTFLLRTVRPVFQGTVFKYIDFRLMPDFAGGTATLQDAYLDLRYWKPTSIRAGKAKAPFGLERLQSESDIWFAERALPTSLVPNRDTGVQVYGDIEKIVSYAVAAVNGAPDGASEDLDTNNGKDFVGRIFATPLQSLKTTWLNGIGFGIAESNGSQAGALPAFKTGGQNTFFSYLSTAHAAGDRYRFSPQISYFVGPFGLLGEWVQSSQEVARTAAARTITNQAWQVTGAYFLTGERSSYGRVTPEKDFEGTRGGPGSLQLVARYNVLALDPLAFAAGYADITKSAQKAKAWGVGVNWYLNRFAKLMFDYEENNFTGGAARGNRPAEKVFLNRFQIAF